MRLICIACHHTAIIKVRQKAILVCTGCGSHVARQVRVARPYMFNGGQIDGEEAKRRTFGGLLSIAKARAYKIEWAAMKFRAIFLPLPIGLFGVRPCDPSSELIWWVRKQNIEYAKKRFPRET